MSIQPALFTLCVVGVIYALNLILAEKPSIRTFYLFLLVLCVWSIINLCR